MEYATYRPRDPGLRSARHDLAGGGLLLREDADSEGEEGLFYLWTVDEIREVLGEKDSAFAIDLWNASSEGNYLDEATQRTNGSNILHLQENFDDATARLEIDRSQLDGRVETVRKTLFENREGRVHPLKDDKILADWNGLMAAAMARAGRVLGEAGYVAAAQASLTFVLTKMTTPDGGLLHRYRDGEAAVEAFLDDYAFLTWACLELYDATLDPAHLERAIELQKKTDELFWDEAGGGYFLTSGRAEELLVRPKESYDGAMPSGNSRGHEQSRVARSAHRPHIVQRPGRCRCHRLLAPVAGGTVRPQPPRRRSAGSGGTLARNRHSRLAERSWHRGAARCRPQRVSSGFRAAAGVRR